MLGGVGELGGVVGDVVVEGGEVLEVVGGEVRKMGVSREKGERRLVEMGGLVRREGG